MNTGFIFVKLIKVKITAAPTKYCTLQLRSDLQQVRKPALISRANFNTLYSGFFLKNSRTLCSKNRTKMTPIFKLINP